MLATAPAPIWLLLPFVLLLVCIALGPIAFPLNWHKYYPHISIGLGAIAAGWFLVNGFFASMFHAFEDYVGFMALIGSLYVASGGIHVGVKGGATPLRNCGFLCVGAILANVIGTTGASMVLIRPWIRMNKHRASAFHIVFFIFIVSNVGGCLTPIGDPPLFIGYLRGVPFWWVLEHCWRAWLLAIAGLVAIFYVIDRANFQRAARETQMAATPGDEPGIRGYRNLVFIAVILSAVLWLPPWWRELTMFCAALGSLLFTPREIHTANNFNFEPLREVAWLFAGIFATMVPALDYLQRNPPPLVDAHAYYWATGALSGVLDNAPTYLAFLATALGRQHLSLDSRADVVAFSGLHPGILEAISLGAVFFGAMTYIGNGPNFMVKAIAEQSRVQVPTFIGYITRFALPVLLPFLAFVGLLFFSRWRIF